MKRLMILFFTAAIMFAGFGSFLLCVPKVSAKQMPSIELNILMYHHFSLQRSRLNQFTILPSQLDSDINYLLQKGYTFVTMQQVVDYVHGNDILPHKPIMLTVDDGYLSFYRYAYPILQKYQVHALLSVIGYYAEQYSVMKDDNVNYGHMTWEQLKEVSDSGLVEVENHSYHMHAQSPRTGVGKLVSETVEQYQTFLYQDLTRLQQDITVHCGKKPITFTYPFGFVGKYTHAVIARLGFSSTLSCEQGVNVLKQGERSVLHCLKRYNRADGICFANFMKNIESKHG